MKKIICEFWQDNELNTHKTNNRYLQKEGKVLLDFFQMMIERALKNDDIETLLNIENIIMEVPIKYYIDNKITLKQVNGIIEIVEKSIEIIRNAGNNEGAL